VTDASAELLRRLRLLEDKEAIRDVLRTIARGVDRFDSGLLSEAIHPDAVLDVSGPRPMTGAAFATGIKPPAEARPGRMHFLSNERIEVTGDTARSESYIVSCQDVLIDGIRNTRIRAGRYLDRFERRAGHWRLSSRTFVDEWSRIDAVGEAITPGAHVGRPAPDDPSYDHSQGEPPESEVTIS
jgi:hypothetical protein